MPSSCYGTRSALAVGLSAAVIVATVGTIVGPARGLFRRLRPMRVLMRIADMALSLPFLPFVIVLTGFLGASTSQHRARRRRCCCGPTPRA